MSQPFTELEMMYLSKLSYSDVPANKMNDGSYCPTLGSIVTSKKVHEGLVQEFGNTPELKNFIDKVSSGNYHIVKADKNNMSGFSAMAISGPDSDTVTIAARGTEFSSESLLTKLKDLDTDLQLGFVAQTDQQRSMDKFMKDFEDYDSIYLTGHSLGGNLAVSGAVGFEDSDKIKGVYTYNAPGQNAAFVFKNKDSIIELSDKITNYQNEGDFISDINIPIGNSVLVKTKSEDTFEWTNKFQNHGLGDFDIANGTFAESGNSKSTIHSIMQTGIGSLTSAFSVYNMANFLGKNCDIKATWEALKTASEMGNEALSEAWDWTKEQYANTKDWLKDRYDDLTIAVDNVTGTIKDNVSDAYNNVKDWVGDKIDQIVNIASGRDDYIFVKPSELSDEAAKIKGYQEEYSEVIQKITNLIITLKQNNIWDAPATTVFMENYMELKEVFDKFARVMSEYSTILEGVASRMDSTDTSLASKFDNLTV